MGESTLRLLLTKCDELEITNLALNWVGESTLRLLLTKCDELEITNLALVFISDLKLVLKFVGRLSAKQSTSPPTTFLCSQKATRWDKDWRGECL